MDKLSKSQFSRLIKQGAVKNMTTGQVITDPDFRITEDTVIKIGKKDFIKFTVAKKVFTLSLFGINIELWNR